MEIVVFLLLLHFVAGGEVSWSVDDIPNPMNNPELCGRIGREKSAICDVANLLDTETKDSIDKRASKMWEVEFAVVVIPSMVSSGWTSESQAEYYADTLRNKWGVGDSELQNGALIFLSVDNRVIFISLGSGLQAKLSSLDVDRVVAHVTPLLKLGDYGSAIERAIIEINIIVTRGMTPLTLSQKKKDNRIFTARVIGPWVLFSLLLAMIFWVQMNNQREKKIKTCRQNLQAYLIELNLPKSPFNSQIITASCPVCFDRYTPNQPLPQDDFTRKLFDQNRPDQREAVIEEVVDPSAENQSIFADSFEKEILQIIEWGSRIRKSSLEVESEHSIIDNQSPDGEEESDRLMPTIGPQRITLPLDEGDFRNPARFSCGHIFCSYCSKTLSNGKIPMTCPLCESDKFRSCSPKNQSDNDSSLSNLKCYDLLYRAKRILNQYPSILTDSIIGSLESAILDRNREGISKIMLDLCCQINQLVEEIEMKKIHIDDKWKQPNEAGRPPHSHLDKFNKID